jgi:hypothetical protein
VAISNTANWSNTGLRDSFVPGTDWQEFEFFFTASQDLAPENSRLQIWYGRTGTLYLDDVVLEQSEGPRRERHPQLSLQGVKNAIPNSSFECGGTGWGCWTPEYYSWGAYPFRLYGALDDTKSRHGGRSWRLAVGGNASPVVRWDYYDPVDNRLQALALGHEGWVVVERGKPCTLSAWVCADRANAPVRLYVQNADGPRRSSAFTVGAEWQRVEMTVTAEGDYACGFVGLDLRESGMAEAALWIDAVQFEQSGAATDYEPRSALESCIATDRAGNVFAEPGQGMALRLNVANAGAAQATARGRLSVTDFTDKVVWEGQLQLAVGGGQTATAVQSGLLAGRRGFFRVRWEPEEGPAQDLRCAIIDPNEDTDTVAGMNHAFGFPFLLELSHMAGLRWWRDWSVKWQTVQPAAASAFDFGVPDVQIDRCLEAGGQVLVLLPFPGARWAVDADEGVMEEIAGERRWMLNTLPASFKPRDIEQWRAYVRASVENYWPRVRIFEILNEPLYTHYAVPARAGYTIDDYLELVRVAYEAAKDVDPAVQIMAGIGTGPESNYVSQFIENGGLDYCDLLNYHRYPGKGWPENSEGIFRDRWQQLVDLGRAMPIWMTEFGIYADDDPPIRPASAGDATMNNAMRRSELVGAAHLIQWAAILQAYGVRKTFYHAGTSAALHNSNAGNVFFEYGGTPRKQYAAIAALTNLIGADFEFVRKWGEPAWLTAFEFRSRGRTVVIAWTREEELQALPLPAGWMALDMMGNAMPGDTVSVTDVPVYLVSP